MTGDDRAGDSTPGAAHVALFARSLSGGGGVERVVVHLATALANRGHRVDVVLARGDGYFVSELSDSVRLVNLNAPPAVAAAPLLLRAPSDLRALLPAMLSPGIAQVIGAIPALVRYLRAARPAALLGALDFANIAAIAAAARCGPGRPRVVASVHNHLSSAVRNAERPHLRRIVPLVRHFYPRADAVVCVSRGVLHDLAALAALPPALLHTIYNPVITERLTVLADAPPPHPWLADDRLRVVLGVGKLRRQKDFATLIRAFARVRATHPDTRLLILGDGPERSRLQALAQELGVAGDCELAGFIANPYPAMRRAGVFALSSAWEGFGNVLVEAMACGCPVVSTDCPSGPGEILDQGRYGPLVKVGDHAALARAIERQLDAPAAERAAGIARAEKFTASASAIAYERVLGIASAPQEPLAEIPTS